MLMNSRYPPPSVLKQSPDSMCMVKKIKYGIRLRELTFPTIQYRSKTRKDKRYCKTKKELKDEEDSSVLHVLTEKC